MPARGGDLQGALDILLPHDVGKVGTLFVRLFRLPLRLGPERRFALQMLHKGHNVRHAVNGHAVGKRCLHGVGRGDIERFDAGARRGHRHGQHAVHRAQCAGERKLADKGRVPGGRLDLLCAGEDTEKDRQIVERAFFLEPRRSKIHRDAGDGKLHAAVFHRRAHALARFLDRRVAEANDVERGKPPGKEALHRDLIARDALKAERTHCCDHILLLPLPRRCGAFCN